MFSSSTSMVSLFYIEIFYLFGVCFVEWGVLSKNPLDLRFFLSCQVFQKPFKAVWTKPLLRGPVTTGGLLPFSFSFRWLWQCLLHTPRCPQQTPAVLGECPLPLALGLLWGPEGPACTQPQAPRVLGSTPRTSSATSLGPYPLRISFRGFRNPLGQMVQVPPPRALTPFVLAGHHGDRPEAPK